MPDPQIRSSDSAEINFMCLGRWSRRPPLLGHYMSRPVQRNKIKEDQVLACLRWRLSGGACMQLRHGLPERSTACTSRAPCCCATADGSAAA